MERYGSAAKKPDEELLALAQSENYVEYNAQVRAWRPMQAENTLLSPCCRNKNSCTSSPAVGIGMACLRLDRALIWPACEACLAWHRGG